MVFSFKTSFAGGTEIVWRECLPSSKKQGEESTMRQNFPLLLKNNQKMWRIFQLSHLL